MIAQKVIGAWELVSFTVSYLDIDRTDYPLGPDATGIIMYTADGHMSAQIMRAGRADYDLFDPNEDVQAAAAAATGTLPTAGRTASMRRITPCTTRSRCRSSRAG